jgi:hypothetical protein
MRNPFPPPLVRPLALSDAEYAAVMRAAQPLQPHRRGNFLEALAKELSTCGELGEGKIYRAIAAVQKRFWDAPLSTTGSLHARRG